MVKTWDEVIKSPDFQGLPDSQKDVARSLYYDDVVKPKVPEGSEDAARQLFFKDTAPQEIMGKFVYAPKGSAASTEFAQEQLAATGAQIKTAATAVPAGILSGAKTVGKVIGGQPDRGGLDTAVNQMEASREATIQQDPSGVARGLDVIGSSALPVVGTEMAATKLLGKGAQAIQQTRGWLGLGTRGAVQAAKGGVMTGATELQQAGGNESPEQARERVGEMTGVGAGLGAAGQVTAESMTAIAPRAKAVGGWLSDFIGKSFGSEKAARSSIAKNIVETRSELAAPTSVEALKGQIQAYPESAMARAAPEYQPSVAAITGDKSFSTVEASVPNYSPVASDTRKDTAISAMERLSTPAKQEAGAAYTKVVEPVKQLDAPTVYSREAAGQQQAAIGAQEQVKNAAYTTLKDNPIARSPVVEAPTIHKILEDVQKAATSPGLAKDTVKSHPINKLLKDQETLSLNDIDTAIKEEGQRLKNLFNKQAGSSGGADTGADIEVSKAINTKLEELRDKIASYLSNNDPEIAATLGNPKKLAKILKEKDRVVTEVPITLETRNLSNPESALLQEPAATKITTTTPTTALYKDVKGGMVAPEKALESVVRKDEVSGRDVNNFLDSFSVDPLMKEEAAKRGIPLPALREEAAKSLDNHLAAKIRDEASDVSGAIDVAKLEKLVSDPSKGYGSALEARPELKAKFTEAVKAAKQKESVDNILEKVFTSTKSAEGKTITDVNLDKAIELTGDVAELSKLHSPEAVQQLKTIADIANAEKASKLVQLNADVSEGAAKAVGALKAGSPVQPARSGSLFSVINKLAEDTYGKAVTKAVLDPTKTMPQILDKVKKLEAAAKASDDLVERVKGAKYNVAVLTALHNMSVEENNKKVPDAVKAPILKRSVNPDTSQKKSELSVENKQYASLNTMNDASGEVKAKIPKLTDAVQKVPYNAEYSKMLGRLPSNDHRRVGNLAIESAHKAGVDPKLALNFANAESGFNIGAKAKTTSAQGVFQMTGAAAKDAEKLIGRPLDMKNPRDNAEAAMAYTKNITERLTKALGRTPPHYLIYTGFHQGVAGAMKLMDKKNQHKSGAALLPEAAKANPKFFYNPNGKPFTVIKVRQNIKDYYESKRLDK